MKKKASGWIYFTSLVLGFVTLVCLPSGCAQVYYGTFRYEAQCLERPQRGETLCTVEKIK